MPRTVRRLSDLEIDEVSLVDRPANQHGRVAIAKRAEEAVAEYVDRDGNEVDPDELEFGDVVFDSETGQPFYFASPEELESLADAGGNEQVDELEEDPENADEDERVLAGVGKARGRGRAPVRKSAQRRTARQPVRKSAKRSSGQSILEELSKALDDGDRDQVISKLAEMVDDSNARAERAELIAKSVREEQEVAAYTQLADTYELPVDPEQLGGILSRVAKALPQADLDILDRVLSAASVGFDELGYNGSNEGDVMGQVMAVAGEAVGKNDGLTIEAATAAFFDANPALYDEYNAESR